MDALILCGGFATRLEPITLFMPKHLLPIGGKPLLEYILQDLSNLNVDRIVIATNKRFEDQFLYWINNRNVNNKQKLELIVEPAINNQVKLGAIKGMKYAIEKANLNNDLLVIAGDNYYDFSLNDVVKKFYSKNAPVICLYNIKSEDDAKRFGVVKINDDLITNFVEKPSAPESTLISTGIYIFSKKELSLIDRYLSDNNNPDSPGYLVQWLIKNTQIYGVVCEGNWVDIGTIDSYKKIFFEKYEGKPLI
ncbi:MAG: nucleotidyltransferase family protein [Candidatus Micrarchaeaceae archaeon]